MIIPHGQVTVKRSLLIFLSFYYLHKLGNLFLYLATKGDEGRGWCGFFVRYIILYGVYMTLLVAVIVILMLLRALIFFLLSSAFADSLTRDMRCAATMSGCTVCFLWGTSPTPRILVCTIYSVSHKQTVSIDLGRGGACSSRVMFAQPFGGEEMNGFSIPR